jgi:cell division protein FtsQ
VSATTVDARRRAGMHPRFRDRRIAVKRDAGRRRLRRVAWLGALASIIVAGYLVTRSPLLDLDHVQVVGLAHTDEAGVRAAGGLHPGEPMTDLDIDRARTAIAALPWVDTVDVARHWPGTVTVKVTERRAVAALEVDASSWLVLDATGRVLETRAVRPDDLAVLSAVGAPAAVPGETVPAAMPGLALAGYITPDLRAWFVDVVTNPDGTLDADLQSHIRVSFGSQAHLSDKMIGLATVLTRVDLKDLDHIDLQVPNSPVLTRRTTSA